MRVRRDPKRYYEALNLQPGATPAEVKIAYTFLSNASQANPRIAMNRVQAAFDHLSIDKNKAKYDAGDVEAMARHERRSIHLPGILVLAVLFVFGGFIFPGFLLPGAPPHHSGDYLVNKLDRAPLGRIVQAEEAHAFPNGAQGRAYLVELTDGSQRWYPASDLEHHYDRTTAP